MQEVSSALDSFTQSLQDVEFPNDVDATQQLLNSQVILKQCNSFLIFCYPSRYAHHLNVTHGPYFGTAVLLYMGPFTVTLQPMPHQLVARTHNIMLHYMLLLFNFLCVFYKTVALFQAYVDSFLHLVPCNYIIFSMSDLSGFCQFL
jgi:hypothetical protein